MSNSVIACSDFSQRGFGDWTAEQRWIEQIVDQRLKAMPAAIGTALARERAAMRAEIRPLAGEIADDISRLERRIQELSVAPLGRAHSTGTGIPLRLCLFLTACCGAVRCP